MISRIMINCLFLLPVAALVPATHAAEIDGANEFSMPAWFKDSFLDLREDVGEASKQNKRVMIFFHQNGCPYCAKLINTNFSQKSIVNYTQKHFEALDINMWGDREVIGLAGTVQSEKIYAQSLKVWFTPTLLFFNEKGKVIHRINGYFPPHRFMAALKYVAEHRETKQSFRDYYASQLPVASTGKLNTESFFIAPPYDLKRLNKQKPLAVFFEQKQCPECDKLHADVLKRKATRGQLTKYHAVQLDMWADTPIVTPNGKTTTTRKWAQQLKINYAPTAVLYDKGNGNEVIRMEAFLKAFHVQSILDYVASGTYKKEKSLQRFVQQRADKMVEQGETVDIWK